MNKKLSRLLAAYGSKQPGWQIYEIQFAYTGDAFHTDPIPPGWLQSDEVWRDQVSLFVTRVGKHIICGDPRRFPSDCPWRDVPTSSESRYITREQAIAFLRYFVAHPEFECSNIFERGCVESEPPRLSTRR